MCPQFPDTNTDTTRRLKQYPAEFNPMSRKQRQHKANIFLLCVYLEHVERQNGMQAGGLLRGGDTFDSVETYW